MSTFITNDFRFIHIPKCGGTFIRSYIMSLKIDMATPLTDGPKNGHVGCVWLKELCNKSSVKTFSSVRNPYTWYPSFYQQLINNNWSSDTFPTVCRDKSIDGFVKKVMKYHSYSHYIDTLIGIPKKIDFVCRMEYLKSDLYDFLKGFNLPEEWKEKLDDYPYINKSNETPKELSYESMELISHGDRRIFEEYGYEVLI